MRVNHTRERLLAKGREAVADPRSGHAEERLARKREWYTEDGF
jgi:hypothetical protein